MIEQLIALIIFRAEVLISDFHIFQAEGLLPAVLRAEASVRGILRAQRILQGMQSFLQIFPGCLLRKTAAVTPLAAHPAVAHIHGLHLQILAQLQIFMKAKAVCSAVMPHQLGAWSLPYLSLIHIYKLTDSSVKIILSVAEFQMLYRRRSPNSRE